MGAQGYDPTAGVSTYGTANNQGKVYVFEDIVTPLTPFLVGSNITLAQSIDYTLSPTYYGQSGDFFGSPYC